METTVAELIRRSRPLAGTASLSPIRPIIPSTSEPPKPPPAATAASQNPNQNILKTINRPTILIGTLTLPSYDATSPPNCSCFQFSDCSAAPICCDILEFDPKILGEKIKIIAWNFIPLKGNNGFLEVIRWNLLESSTKFSSYSSNLYSISMNSKSSIDSKECNDTLKARNFIYGAVDSISPVSVIPCKDGDSSYSKKDLRSLCGFLVNMFVCECILCGSKDLTGALIDLGEANANRHCFDKRMIVYFCGSASSWHPLMIKFVGNIILLTGLRKKLVYIEKEESTLMYVTTDKAILHLPKLAKRRVLDKKVDVRGNGECGCYTGTVTGSYMQGMVVELDEKVMLLLTDKQLSVPHSLRVGAVVSIKNVHFLNPRFSWMKCLILGACLRTTITVEAFSPLETGCHMTLHSQSLLGKFIESLAFGARLWVLLLIASFKKMFAGIFSEKDILGSKHKEGLAQKFASSHITPSDCQIRHGVFVDFLKHDSCACGHGARYGHLKLVVPVSALVSHCNAKWAKMLLDHETAYGVMGSNHLHNSLSCAGRTYAQPIKRILHNEQVGVILIGSLKTSSSGRLQLGDATGSIDVVVSDLPATWNFSRLCEIKDFNITMEGVAEKVDQLCKLPYELFTCRSIFSSSPPVRGMPKSLYLSYNVRDNQFLNCPCPFCMNWKICSKVLESGKYHLLWLMHKFPVLQKFHGDRIISSKSTVFAEVIMLSWNLVLSEKDRDVETNLCSSAQERDSVQHFPRNENGEWVFKRCKVDRSSDQGATYDTSDANNELHTHRCSYVKGNCYDFNCPSEIPCKITGRSVSDQSVGVLSYTGADGKIRSQHRRCVRKVLLEFSSESFPLYQALRIGGYYIVKHSKEDVSCSVKDCNDAFGLKVQVTPGMHFWGISFSCIDFVIDSNMSINSHYPFADNNDASNNKVLSRAETCSDINLCMPASLINFVKLNCEIVDGLLRPPFSVKEETEMHNCQERRISSSLKSFQISYPGNLLPAGNLISLRGLVTLVHDCKQNPFAAHAIRGSSDAIFQPVLAEGSSSICVHIMMDNGNVKIVGPFRKGAYPTGFGQGVHASFHRILELHEQNEYRMIPASFIVIDSLNPFNERSGIWNDNASVTLGSERVTLPVAIPSVLISELLHSMEGMPVQLHCRVLAVYFLILQKSRGAPSGRSELSVLDIALAGFILDDGTSPCCCWANNERAATLLRLHIEDVPHEFCRTTQSSKQTRVKHVPGLTAGHLNEITQKHGRVIVKNHGSAFDYSCSDLTFSSSSEKSFSSSDDDVFRCLILNACFSTVWTVFGSLMDSNAMEQLEKQLTEHQMTILPLPNIWATGIHHMDPLHEARNIYKELVHS